MDVTDLQRHPDETAPEAAEATALYGRALDPGDPGVAILARPGQRLPTRLEAGDLALWLPEFGRARLGLILEPDVGGARSPAAPPGRYARVRAAGGDAPVLRRIAGPDGVVLPGLLLLRASEEAGRAEVLPPPRPTIRPGSRGPAVAEAQTRLNAVHANRVAAGRPGLERCPLAVDGVFGLNTRRAVVSFQRLAFPDLPSEWDGIVGPRTWAAMEAFVRDRPAPPVEPPTPIQPVVHGPLDPTRWGPMLAPLLSPRARLRAGNAVRPLIDGPETFRLMATDMRAASGPRDYIYLLGWDNFDEFELVPGDRRSTFQALFNAAAGRGVEVAAMLWTQPLPSISPPGLNPARLSAERVVRRINACPEARRSWTT